MLLLNYPKMSSTFLVDYFSSCKQVTNCRLVTMDGKEYLTHKIILAARSTFFRDMFEDIPDTGGDTIIILPHYSYQEVTQFLEKILESFNSSSMEDMDTLLFNLVETNPSTCDEKPGSINHIPEEKLDNVIDDIYTEGNGVKDNDNATITEDLTKNTLKTKQSLYKKAIDSYLQGCFSSLNQVAKHYRLPYSSLYGVFVSRGTYRGRGRKAAVFTPQEELEISSMVIKIAKDGNEITWNSLKSMLEEHMERLISMKDTVKASATRGRLLNKHFVRRFAKRNNLLGYIHIQNLHCVQGTHLCNQCEKKFIFQNELVKHLKTVHE